MGPQGIRETALTCHDKANRLCEKLVALPGVEALFDGPTFHEFAIRLPVPASLVIERMIESHILAGIALNDFVADRVDHAETALLVAVTEKRTELEIDAYAGVMAKVLKDMTKRV